MRLKLIVQPSTKPLLYNRVVVASWPFSASANVFVLLFWDCTWNLQVVQQGPVPEKADLRLFLIKIVFRFCILPFYVCIAHTNT